VKKLIVLLALLVSGISFSNTNTNVSKSKSLCKWIKNPNIYVSKEIDLINHSQLKGDIYCDVENDYMTYYVGIGNIEIGLLYNLREKKELTYENIFNILADFQSDILKLLPTNIPEKDEKNKPRYYTYRLYVYDAKRGDTYMLFKYIYDTAKPDGDWKIYYNNEIFSKTSENMQRVLKNAGYLPTEDIVY
jgi:hypothetical protein